jgi:hypothetical protein
VAEILRFLADQCAFLFGPNGFRFVDSQEHAKGTAVAILESAVVRLRFERERGELVLSFQPIHGKHGEWFSPGLLRGLLVGNRGGSEVLDVEWARFLEGALPELETRLANPDTADETIALLRDQARQRAKDLFG